MTSSRIGDQELTTKEDGKNSPGRNAKRSVEKLRRNIKAKDRKGKEVVDVKFVFLLGGGEWLPLAPVLYNN